MRSRDLFQLAWRNLMRRKSRTFLTILSVVIGAVSIIIMLSLGFGMQKQQKEAFEQFTMLSTVQVSPTNYYDPYNPPKSKKGFITDEVIQEIKALPQVKGVLPSIRVDAQIALKDKKRTLVGQEIMAVDFSGLDPSETVFADGGFPTNPKQNTFIIGSRVDVYKTVRVPGQPNPDMQPDSEYDWNKGKFYVELTGSGAPSGPYDNAESMPGINAEKTEKIPMLYGGRFQKSDSLQPYNIYISMETRERILKAQEKLASEAEKSQNGENIPKKQKPKKVYYDQLLVRVKESRDTGTVTEAINKMGLSAYSDEAMLENQKKSMQTLQLILGGIGSVALLVASIGIANTMLMSIYERKKEIGVMKVIGAQLRDVRRMFLVESMMIGTLGGLFGIFSSYGISALINQVAGKMSEDLMNMGAESGTSISYIPIWLPFAAFAFSALVGLLAGYIPAKRATDVSAIEAIRSND